MTRHRASDRDVDRVIRSWLHEDRHEDASRLAGAVLDRVDTIPQRRATSWPAWRTPVMNKIIATGLGVAAVVALLFVSSTLFGSFGPRLGGDPSASAAPSDAPASVEPSGSVDGSLPPGLHAMEIPFRSNQDIVTVMIPASGWFASPDGGSVSKDLGGGNRVTVVVAPHDYYQVPSDTCSWRDGPSRLAETVEDLVGALAAQTYETPGGSVTREFSSPSDIVIDGHAGQAITSVTPVDTTSDPAGCDQQRFCSLLDRDGGTCLLSHLEPGALDTVWVVDGGSLQGGHVVAASYWPTTSPELLAEMNAIVESMNIIDEVEAP